MKDRIRVGLIGAGNVALLDHLPAYLALPDQFHVVAVADPTPARRELARSQAGLGESGSHANAADLLARRDLDMVDICTPQHVRRALVMAACQAHLHVLTEKPIATTLADAAAMVAAARDHGVRYGIVHNYLYLPEILRTLAIIQSGRIGPVEVAILNWLSVLDAPGNAAYRPAWRHDVSQSGGGVLMDMLHIVYLAEAFLGMPIERVSAFITARVDDSPVEDITLSRFESESNAALVNVGWGMGPGGFVVAGTDGRIEVTYQDGSSGAFAPFERLLVQSRDGPSEEFSLPPDDSMLRVLLDFAAAIREERDPAASGEHALHILDATLAAYASAATGRTVELPLSPDHPVYQRGVAGLGDLDIPVWSSVRRRRIFGLPG